jgi:hypothetical protein
MGNPAHSRTFHYTGATAVSNTEDANFPDANLIDWTHPYRPWKTSGALVNGTSYGGFTWASSQAMVGAYFDDWNVSSLFIESKDSGSTWTPRHTITLPQCPQTLKYKGYLTLHSAFLTTYGLRARANSASTTDGASQMRGGTLIPVTSISEWGSPITPSYGEDVDRDSIGDDREPVAIGNYRAEMIFNIKMGLASLLRNDLLELKRHKPGYFLFIQDISASTTNPTEKAWVCKQMNSPALQYPDNNAGVQIQSLVLREAD